jgi:predicted dehydrogenase
MNIGIVGFGLIGQQRANDIKRMKEHRVAAVCDVNTDLVTKKQKEFGYEIESNWEKLVSRNDIQVVIVAVPHYLASEIAAAALYCGKHVLCEKPMGRNPAESTRIIEAARRNKVLIEPGFNYRFYPGVLKLRQLIEDNAIGKVTHVRFVLGHGGRPGMENEWKTSKELCGGGALLDPGIHAIDLFRFLFGEIVEGTVFFKNSFWDIDVEDNAFVFLKTQSGQIISAHFSITEWKSLFRMEVFGTDGYVSLTGRSKSYGAQKVSFGARWFWRENHKEQNWEYSAEDNSFFEELNAFLNKITGRENQCLAAPEDAVKAIDVIENLYRYGRFQKKLNPNYR